MEGELPVSVDNSKQNTTDDNLPQKETKRNCIGIPVWQSDPDGNLVLCQEVSISSKDELPLNENFNFDINLLKDLNPPICEANEIGRGGFARVFKSKFEGQDVAVKFFHQQFQEDWENDSEDKMIKELNIICRLKHNNIVNCLGASLKPRQKAIIMEFVDFSLHDYIYRMEREGKIKLIRIFKFLKSIAKALKFLHESARIEHRGIVHRDLHPKNILLTKEGKVKVADFGISHLMEETTMFVTSYEGMPDYVAPEIFLENKVKKKSDIYSLGMIAWEMWAQRQPWKLCPYGFIINQVTQGYRPEIPNDTPDILKQLIVKCWQQDYNQRPSASYVYQKCKQIVKEIEQQRQTAQN
eukprot:TRINITY_DN1598_c0_g1_i22.p1 TRINITY_DN1598_c0_g1~~TRINITY_DN1598_c0_g1_i22.p1  ORF type:complete len:411 (-),score=31.68 TRINITY_DN1598_c0_g1_i22:410-1471(-)